MKIDELINILAKGESETAEFKSAFVRDTSKDICAFLNTVGGHLFIGVNDEGQVVGVNDNGLGQKVSDVLQGIYPSPKVKMEELTVGEKTVYHLEVKASDKLHSMGNVVYIRIGRNNRPLTTQEVIEKAAESAIVFFDELPSFAPLDSVSRSIVGRYLEKRTDLRGVKKRGDIDENLLLLKIVRASDGEKKPTNGGILFFSEHPQDYIPNARVRLVWFESEAMDRYTDSREFTGPVWEIVDSIEEYFEKNLKVVGGSMTGWKRGDFPEYPPEALREAVINALTHRNYFDPAEVQIFIYPSRIRIKNPGNFPPGITPEEPAHKPRNPLLSQYMYDMGYIEKYGSGINRIKEACSKHPLVDVEFILKPYRTEIVFTKQAISGLEEIDEQIIRLLKNAGVSTSAQLSRELGISKVSVLKHLSRLISTGYVIRTGSGRSTKYSAGVISENIE